MSHTSLLPSGLSPAAGRRWPTSASLSSVEKNLGWITFFVVSPGFVLLFSRAAFHFIFFKVLSVKCTHRLSINSALRGLSRPHSH
jgi:hypothetical protein